jgi:hypothetical protein
MARDSDRRDASAQAKRNRLWVLVLGIATGVVAPLLVSALFALAHLRSH